MKDRTLTRLTAPFVTFSVIALASLLWAAPPPAPAPPATLRETVVRISTGEEIKLYEGSYALVFGESDYINGWLPLRMARWI